MAVKIPFDSAMLPIMPTFVLATRSGEKLGTLPVSHLHFADEFASKSDLQFVVYKYNNDVELAIWDQIADFKLVWCPEWDIWYEISVEINETNTILKNVSCSTLGVAELSQIMIYNTEINTEDDIARDDYVPTTLYNGFNPNASLLHRILEKAPHYTIEHVDSTIARIQRTFSFDNKSICDVFKEIAEEVGCLFVYNSGTKNGAIERSISVYDLESNCIECGFRGEFDDVCPNCGSTSIQAGYGEDTNILATIDNIASEIGYSSDTGSVKNCFRLVADDDLMTATIANCNPNGSSYIWHITDETMSDMSDVLRAKIKAYNVLYEHFRNENEAVIDSGLLTSYNSLIAKYQTYRPELRPLPQSFVGYASLMDAYYDTIDFNLFLQSQLMPSPYIAETSAALEASKLTTTNLSPIGVTNIATCSNATATSAVLAIAKTLVDPRYQVKVASSSYQNRVWSGVFNVVSYADETDTASTGTIYIVITGDYETYVRQRIEKLLNQGSDYVTDISDLFKLNNSNFAGAIRRYCLNSLVSFQSACQGCIDILVEQGIANDETWASEENNLYRNLYMPYYQKLQILEAEIALREYEISIIAGIRDVNDELIEDGVQTLIMYQVRQIQSALDFEKFLGETLWKEFAAYRREDTYQNDNFISDGLSTAELFENAREYISVASNELFKASTLQHSISSKLKNLLVIDSFKPIINNFKIGNWIRIGVDGKICKLRLIRYEIDFDNLSNIDVSFSDVKQVRNGLTDLQSILNNASSMSSSYEATIRQVTQNKKAKQIVNDWVNKGLDMTQAKIVSNATDQSITWDEHGILCRQYDSISDSYDDRQLKIINRGLYVTDNNWLTSKAGIGDFIFYNPETGQMEEAYGVIADTLVGNLILSQKVGIYNEGNTIKLDENGITLVSDVIGRNTDVFKIQRKYLDGDNNEVVENVIYFDNEGNANFIGQITATSLRIVTDGSTSVPISEYVDDRFGDALDSTVSNVEIEYGVSASSSTPPSSWSTSAPAWSANQYIWSRTKITKGDDSIYYKPSEDGICIEGQDGLSIDDIEEQYYLSTSQSTQTGGSWLDACPSFVLGKYYWTRSKITWNDTSVTYTTPILATGLNDANLTATAAHTLAYNITTGDNKIDFHINNTNARVEIDNTSGLKITGLSGNYFQVTDSQMGFFASNGEPQLAFSNGDLAISGVLTALTSSNIAGWYTTSDAIYRGSSAFDASNGIYFGSSGLSLGNAFKVSVTNTNNTYSFSEFTLGSPTNGLYPLSYKFDSDEGKYVLSLNSVEFDDSFISTVSSISASTVNAYNSIYRTTIIDGTTPIFPSGASDGDIGVLYDVTASSSSNNFSFTAQSISVYGSNQQSYLYGFYDTVGGLNMLVNSQYATDGSNISSSFANYCRAGRSQGTTGNHMPGLAYRNFVISGSASSGSQVKISFTYSTWVYTGTSGNYEMEAGKSRSTLPIYLYDVTAGRRVGVCTSFIGHSGNTTEKCTESYTITLTNSIASGNIVAVVFYSDTTKTLVHIDLSSITLLNTVSNSTSTTTTRAIYIRDNGAWVMMADGSSSGSGGGSYNLPVANSSTLGGIKVGSGLSIATDGTLSVIGASVSEPLYYVNNTMYLFYTNKFQVVTHNGSRCLDLKLGTGLAENTNGEIYVTSSGGVSISYTAPSAGQSGSTQKTAANIYYRAGTSGTWQYTSGNFVASDCGTINSTSIYCNTQILFFSFMYASMQGTQFQLLVPGYSGCYATHFSIEVETDYVNDTMITGFCNHANLEAWMFTVPDSGRQYIQINSISGREENIIVKRLYIYYN